MVNINASIVIIILKFIISVDRYMLSESIVGSLCIRCAKAGQHWLGVKACSHSSVAFVTTLSLVFLYDFVLEGTLYLGSKT